MSLLLLISTLPGITFAKEWDMDYSNYRQVATGMDGMVATAHPLASKVGADVLARGGNAIDAAVAIQFALNVTEPMMSGIGGGGFLMYYDAKTDKTQIVNSRERAPDGATPDMFLNEAGEPISFAERATGGKAVGVPGTLKGLEEALNRWGTLPMAELIEPAIELARGGFPIDSVLANAIEDNKMMLAFKEAGNIFVPNGTPLREGDLLVQKDLAKTFELIKSQGTDVFYKGEIAQAIAQAVQQYGGSMTPEDLSTYAVTMDNPIWGDYKDYQIASMPPPSSGGVFLLQMLGILDGFNLSQYDVKSWQKYHLLAESMHLAYADRAVYAGDPDFVDVPLEGLLNPAYIQERKNLISLDSMIKKPEAGNPWAYENKEAASAQTKQPNDNKLGETTHYSVTDQWGNVVSNTTTIEQLFGTGIMVPEYGILLNNELTDFDAVPGGANQVEPNKRPLSSMTPTIVFKDGKPVLTVGSPGGPTIITSVLQTIIHSIEYDMELKSAVEEPRIYTNSTASYRYEDGIPEEAMDHLRKLGHQFGEKPVTIGNVQSILIDQKEGTYKGVADSSRNGAAIGVTK
ncbi:MULTISPECIES: gamma-glutamyltransferase [unclassified Sporosarcina]|uniref:gamma-glutamyltransferase n=1 Tax=unclassified Sporosarcina TaxID=2647733 RepID=UPI00203C61AD|nr:MULTISPECIES: gamma-glutamyltransferase [unclassified Sporosarcina]